MPILLTMGPRLSIAADIPVARVGESATIRFRPVLPAGDVKWRLVSEDFGAEWSGLTLDGDDALFSTADAVTWGTYTITVQCVDMYRVPVRETFSLYVIPEAISVSGDSSFDWSIGESYSVTFSISGGTGEYVSLDATGLPAGMSASMAGSTITVSGTVSTISSGTGRLVVTDSIGGAGVAEFSWNVQSEPMILAGGAFTTMSGATRNRLARIKVDGTLDATFSPSFNGNVNGLVADKYGRIYAVGAFTTVNGSTHNRIVKLNYDGSVDSSFACSIDTEVYGISAAGDGLIVWGLFSLINGVSKPRIGKIDYEGNTVTGFTPPAFNNQVLSAAALSTGKIIVSGYFSRVNGSSSYGRIAVLNADGTLDTGKTFAVSGPAGGYGVKIVEQDSGKILLFGLFSAVNGTTVYNCVRLNADFSVDVTFTPNFTPNGTTDGVTDSSGNITIGGNFYILNGNARPNFAKVSASGVDVWGADKQVNGNVTAIVALPNGDTVIGGYFTSIQSTTRNRIARMTSGGTLVSGFNPNANAQVTSLALIPASTDLALLITASPSVPATLEKDVAMTPITFSTTNGVGPYTYSISAGALPAGTSLNASTGVWSGTPTTAASYSFTVKTTDVNGKEGTMSFAVTVKVIAAYTYYELNVTAVNSYCVTTEFVVGYTTTDWCDTYRGSLVIASSGDLAGSQHAKGNAFDGNTTSTNCWASSVSSSGWLRVQFPTAVKGQWFKVYPRGSYNQSPKTFTIRGSNDGVTWDTLVTASYVTDWTYSPQTAKTYYAS